MTPDENYIDEWDVSATSATSVSDLDVIQYAAAVLQYLAVSYTVMLDNYVVSIATVIKYLTRDTASQGIITYFGFSTVGIHLLALRPRCSRFYFHVILKRSLTRSIATIMSCPCKLENEQDIILRLMNIKARAHLSTPVTRGDQQP